MNKKIYREFCSKEASLPVFINDWWLDAVCGESNWDVVLVQKENSVVGALPYFRVKKGFYKGMALPPLTPHLGPYIAYPENQKYSSRLSWEKEIMEQLIGGLPAFDFYISAFPPSLTNWLPFYWKGFLQATKYTYVLDDLSEPDLLAANFSHEKRKNLKRASQLLSLHTDFTADQFYDHHQASLAKTGQKINYSRELFRNLANAAIARESGRIVYATDKDNIIHSALFVVWDSQYGYNLVSTIDPAYRSSGSIALLIRDTIFHLSSLTKGFDFEGSMIENVETSFRHYGTKQVPYFKIMKYNPMILRIIKGFRHSI